MREQHQEQAQDAHRPQEPLEQANIPVKTFRPDIDEERVENRDGKCGREGACAGEPQIETSTLSFASSPASAYARTRKPT
jgi:hypothetical protein